MNIGIIGAGYVGLTTAICLSTIGHKIFLYDINQQKLDKIQRKIMPFYEEGLEKRLEDSINSQKLIICNKLSNLIKETQGCFVCVGTPSKNNQIDLSQIKLAVNELGFEINKMNMEKYVVIIRSTVIPSTTRKIIQPILEKESENKFSLLMIPEFLREGQAYYDFMNPDKIVIGYMDEYGKEFAIKIFDLFAKSSKFIYTNVETAELIKYANNGFFSTLISFSNEIANISENLKDVDPFEVMNALILDKRIKVNSKGEELYPGLSTYLVPGCGFGGSCFPKDIRAILEFANTNGVKTPLLNAVLEINQQRPMKIINLVGKLLEDFKGKKIAILGLAFKPNTDDIRESASLEVIRMLNDKDCQISAYDPKVMNNPFQNTNVNLRITENLKKCLEDADVAILLTSWPEFKKINQDTLKKYMKNPIIIDGRGFLDPLNFDKKSYIKIGLNDF